MAVDLLPLSGPSPGWLSVSPLSAGPSLVVVVAGEADWGTASQLRDQLTAALAYGPQSVALDLTDLTFCNLTGLRALIEVVEVAQRAGADVVLRGTPELLSCLLRTYAAHRRTGGQPGFYASGTSVLRSCTKGARRASSR